MTNYREEGLIEAIAAMNFRSKQERDDLLTKANAEMAGWRDTLQRINAQLEEAIKIEKLCRAERNAAVQYIHTAYEEKRKAMKKSGHIDPDFEAVLAGVRKEFS